jgi:spoIIIJ-associated protein
LRPRGEAPAETAPDTSAPSPRGQRGGRGRGPGGDRPDRGNGGDRPERGSGGEQPPSRPRGERRERREFEPEGNIVPDINAEEVDFAAQTVDDILRLLDIDASLNIREPITPGDGLGMALAVIDISGDDLGLLIGRRGDTLLSLQYVVNLIVSRRYPGKGGVTIDVEHYRHRREEQVVSLAQRMAERVREHGSPITLEPMSAAERRLVHLALAEDAELETNSIGEGENRKVVISRR